MEKFAVMLGGSGYILCGLVVFVKLFYFILNERWSLINFMFFGSIYMVMAEDESQRKFRRRQNILSLTVVVLFLCNVFVTKFIFSQNTSVYGVEATARFAHD